MFFDRVPRVTPCGVTPRDGRTDPLPPHERRGVTREVISQLFTAQNLSNVSKVTAWYKNQNQKILTIPQTT